jgi:hypothetical protein
MIMSSQYPDLSKILTWTLVPPHGVRFQNDVGSNCTIYLPRGREEEVAKVLQDQISYHLMWSKGLVPGQPTLARTDPMPIGVDPTTGTITKRGVTVHDNDNEECPWNDPETHANPVTAGIACTCGKREGA